MLRNKGTGLLSLRWNGIEVFLEVGQTIDVKVFGSEAEKDKSILEDRFIAKYPDSIERVIEKDPSGKVYKKGSEAEIEKAKTDLGSGPDVKRKVSASKKKK